MNGYMVLTEPVALLSEELHPARSWGWEATTHPYQGQLPFICSSAISLRAIMFCKR